MSRRLLTDAWFFSLVLAGQMLQNRYDDPYRVWWKRCEKIDCIPEKWTQQARSFGGCGDGRNVISAELLSRWPNPAIDLHVPPVTSLPWLTPKEVVLRELRAVSEDNVVVHSFKANERTTTHRSDDTTALRQQVDQYSTEIVRTRASLFRWCAAWHLPMPAVFRSVRFSFGRTLCGGNC